MNSEFPQAQRVETDRVLDVVVAPTAEGDVLKPLPRVVVARRKAAIDQALRDPIGFGGANFRRSQRGAHDPLGGDRAAADEIGVAHQRAAEVLGPRMV